VIVFKQLFSGPIVRSHSGPHFYSPLVAHVHRYCGDLTIERGCPPSKGQGHTFESCRVHLRYFTPRFPRPARGHRYDSPRPTAMTRSCQLNDSAAVDNAIQVTTWPESPPHHCHTTSHA
jgi:hypothetical protein